MFDWVPLPVCQTTRGKLSSNLPSTTSPAAAMMASASCGSSAPLSLLACAQAFLITPSARTMATGWVSQPIGKFMIERCVCAPQYLSVGTSSGPKLSVSVRVAVMGQASSECCLLLPQGTRKTRLHTVGYHACGSENLHESGLSAVGQGCHRRKGPPDSRRRDRSGHLRHRSRLTTSAS